MKTHESDPLETWHHSSPWHFVEACWMLILGWEGPRWEVVLGLRHSMSVQICISAEYTFFLILYCYHWVMHYMSWLLIQIQVPFDRYFKVEPLQRYHRVLTMETFMVELAPAIWPPGNRTGNGSVAVCWFWLLFDGVNVKRFSRLQFLFWNSLFDDISVKL